jgi:probable phosphoglycerate mutase
MITITFVRHGNTHWNREKRAQGHQNNPLNEIGFEQARAVAERLVDGKWDLIASSDLLRTKQTADVIVERLGRKIDFLDQRLREIGGGQFEGTLEHERIERWGPDWRNKRKEVGAETNEEVRARGLDFVASMVEQYPGKHLLVISHGLLIGQILKGLMQDESTGKALQNTSVTTVTLKDGKWEYLLFNCTKHLEAIEQAAAASQPEGM